MSFRSFEPEKALLHIQDMLDSIAKIRRSLDGVTFGEFLKNEDKTSACERNILTISEASRHVPDEWKEEFGPFILWRQIASIGNIIRHDYRNVNMQFIWEVYENDLDPLEIALERMIARHGP
jgi:uncharacterized protein with HEPN domain